jgi:hypothetical protein
MGEDYEVKVRFEEDPKVTLTLSKGGGGQALIKSRPVGLLCSYTCETVIASFYEGEAIEVKWKLGRGTSQLTWAKGAGTCIGSSEALEGSCTVPMEAATELVADLG